MQLIFYISVFNILILVEAKETIEIRLNNRPKLRWKEKVMWRGDKSGRAGGQEQRANAPLQCEGYRCPGKGDQSWSWLGDRIHKCQQEAINSNA